MDRVFVPGRFGRFAFAIFCIGSLVGIIVFLETLAPHFDAYHQTISELALEPNGYLLGVAFCALSFSLFLLGWQWRATPLHLVGKGLILAGLFFLVTGGVPLTLSVGIHVFSVMFALVFWMLSIYGMLRHPRVASKLRVFSGVIFGLVLLLGVLGPHGLPLGLLERLVLLILLGWQIVVSIFTYVKSFSLLI